MLLRSELPFVETKLDLVAAAARENIAEVAVKAAEGSVADAESKALK